MRVSLFIPGLIGLAFAVTATAQTPNTPTTGKFDGAYAFVSMVNLNETPKHGTGHCLSAGTLSALTIENGEVRYSATGGPGPTTVFEGFVNAQGEFTTKGTNPRSGTTISGYGKINDNGTVLLKWIGWFCDFNVIWKKL
jgi:hypothetical protein